MTSKEKAKELVAKFITADYENRQYLITHEAAIKCAILSVKERIDDLEITTGHCELRRLDLQEVESDFKYLLSIKTELEAMKGGKE